MSEKPIIVDVNSRDVFRRLRVDLRVTYLSAESVDQCVRSVCGVFYDYGLDLPQNWLAFCQDGFSSWQMPARLFHYCNAEALRSILGSGLIPGNLRPGWKVPDGEEGNVLFAQFGTNWFSELSFFKYDPFRTEFRNRLHPLDVFKIEIDVEGLPGFNRIFKETPEIWMSPVIVPPRSVCFDYHG